MLILLSKNQIKIILDLFKMKNKIILYIQEDFRTGGAEQQLFYLAKNLPEGYTPVFLALNLKHNFGKIYENYGFRVLELRLNKLNNIFYLFKSLLKIKREIKKINPDIIHSQLWMGNLISRIIGKILNIPVITSERNIYSERNFIHKFLDKSLINLSRYHIANSRGVIDYTSKQEKISKKKFKLIYNGIDFNRFINAKDVRFKFNLKKNDIILTTVGSLTEQKGQEFLINAFYKYLNNNNYSNLFLLIVGEGPLELKLKKLVNNLNLSNKVIFTGNRDDVENILYSSDIFVFTSLYEGLPNAVMEAMLSSLPVLSFNISGCDELIENNKSGYLVKKLDFFEFNQRLKKLIEDKFLRKKFGDVAYRKIIDNFAVDKMVNNYLELYESIINKNEK